jgi:hypothetical protein
MAASPARCHGQSLPSYYVIVLGSADLVALTSSATRISPEGIRRRSHDPDSETRRIINELPATEILFRLLAEGTQPSSHDHPRSRWRHREFKKSSLRTPSGSGSASTSTEQIIGRLVDACDKFLAARARTERRNKAWAIGLTLVAFAAAIAFFAIGNVVAGCAFLSLPVFTLLSKLI